MRPPGPEPSPSDLLALAAQDLACYGTLLWPEFVLSAHVEVLVSALEQVDRGDVKRVIVTMPPRHGKSLLCSILGAHLWASLYQGRPVPAGGAIFREEWFGTCRDLPAFLRVVQAWDTGFKASAAADYSACVTIGETKAGSSSRTSGEAASNFPS